MICSSFSLQQLRNFTWSCWSFTCSSYNLHLVCQGIAISVLLKRNKNQNQELISRPNFTFSTRNYQFFFSCANKEAWIKIHTRFYYLTIKAKQPWLHLQLPHLLSVIRRGNNIAAPRYQGTCWPISNIHGKTFFYVNESLCSTTYLSDTPHAACSFLSRKCPSSCVSPSDYSYLISSTQIKILVFKCLTCRFLDFS